ncbi:MAG: M20/M25/M40 family metallo-hydrolase [Acidobacteriota bacterium]
MKLWSCLAPSRPLRVVQCLSSLLLIAFTSTVLAASPAPSDPAGELTWITIGADAFATLQQATDVTRGHQPLNKFAERSGVVLTRVATRDLPDISAKMHTAHRRCGGFLAHRSLAEAQATLSRVDQAQRGTIEYLLDQQPLVQQLASLVQEAPILSTIEALSTDFNNRFHAHPSGTLASEWIRDRWHSFTLARPDVTVELVNHPGVSQPSVVLTIPGSIRADEVVVLGGHLDSIASGSSNPDFLAPGADDDASGIAVLTEVIRVAMAGDFRPQRTIRFMGYAAEEIGLVGSQDIAASSRAAGVDVVAVLQLDMTAYNGSTEDFGLLNDFTNSTLTTFLTQLIDTYQPERQWTLTACGYGCSDHAAWHNQGFPAAMPFETRFGQHNPTIHSTSDTLATLNNSAAHAAKFARLGVAFMAEIGIDDAGELFANGFEEGSTEGWTHTLP